METAPESTDEITEESSPAQPNSDNEEYRAELTPETTSFEIEDSEYGEILEIINSFKEDLENEASKYDRMVDVIATEGNMASHINSDFPKLHFSRSEGTARSPIFKTIPSHIRLRIWGNLFSAPSDKKINLSKDFVTKYVFPEDYFISPWDIIEPIEGAISSCRQMRQEILWYFWHEFHFHVTFSPFTTGPTLSGLSIRWLNPYAKWIKNLTIEVDLTRLVFSKAPNATRLSLSRSCIMVYGLIDNLVKALLERSKVEDDVFPSQGKHAKVHIENLHLMVRRYKGVREVLLNGTMSTPDSYTSYSTSSSTGSSASFLTCSSTGSSTGCATGSSISYDSTPSTMSAIFKTEPFCPDDVLTIFDPIFDLKELVVNCRMSGFSRPYCAMMFNALFDCATLSTPANGDLAWPNYEPPPQETPFLSEMALSPETVPDEGTKKGKKKKKRTTQAAKKALSEATSLSQESQFEHSSSTVSQESQFEAVSPSPVAQGYQSEVEYSPDIPLPSSEESSPSLAETVGLGILLDPMGRGGNGYSSSALAMNDRIAQAQGAAEFSVLEGLEVPQITLPPIVDPSPITKVESPDSINDLNERDPAYVFTLAALRIGRSFTVGIDGADTDGADTDGADTDGADTDGADTDGADTDGADTEGADTDGADTDGADTEGKEEFIGRRRCKSG